MNAPHCHLRPMKTTNDQILLLTNARHTLGENARVANQGGQIFHKYAGVIAQFDNHEDAQKAMLEAGWTLARVGLFADIFTA